MRSAMRSRTRSRPSSSSWRRRPPTGQPTPTSWPPSAGRFRLADGGHEVGVGWPVGGLRRQLELEGLDLVRDRIADLMAEVGVLVHRADLLLALLLREVLHG